MAAIRIELEDMPMGHRLPNHRGLCRFLHGHNYKITISIDGGITAETGMIADFSEIKRKTKAILEDFDHAMCLFEGDPYAEQFVASGQRVVIIDAPPTAENLAVLWQGMLSEAFPDNHITITVHETNRCCAATGGGERRVYVTHLSAGR